ncbi:MAG: hypothetical protein V1731_03005 [Candidatus Aenigmatarchaeota archaeon]
MSGFKFSSRNASKQTFYKHHPVIVWGCLILFGLLILAFIGIVFTSTPQSQPQAFTAIVAKGPIAGATVSVYELKDDGTKGNLLLGSMTSDASGSVDFSVLKELPQRILVESSGGTYRDEVTGAQVQLSSNDVIRSVLPAGIRQAAVTPFTNMAAALATALMQQGISAGDAVTQANIVIAQQYQLQSVLEVVPVAANDPTAMKVANLEERKYSALLAGLDQEAHNMNVRPIDLAQAIANDWSDGIVDGKTNGNPITVNDLSGNPVQITANTGLLDLQTAANIFLAGTSDATKLNDMHISLNPVRADTTFAITTTALPVWESGKSGAFTITASGGTPPYIWSLKQGSALPNGFTLSKDGILSGKSTLSLGTTRSISPPFIITVSDSSSPANTREIELRITTVQSAPQLTLTTARCMADRRCSAQVATATGGTPPYYFKSDTFRVGAPPIGMMIDLNGYLTGTPKVQGTYTFGVCVVDMVGGSSCGTTNVYVAEAIPGAGIANLTLFWAGTGSGSLGWSSGSILSKDCGTTDSGIYWCILPYRLGAKVTITNEPDDESTFDGWSGECAGTDECIVTLDKDKTVVVNFKSKSETWTGKIIGTFLEEGCAWCEKGTLGINLDVSMTFSDSLVAALRGNSSDQYYSPANGYGYVSGTSSVAKAPVSNTADCTCQITGGSVTNIPVDVGSYMDKGKATISIFSSNMTYAIAVGGLTHDCPNDFLTHPVSEYGVTMVPTSITNTVIKGNLDDDEDHSGTFTLTKK